VGCLFCGKEIGPIRVLRDSEFCTPSHRLLYLDHALQRIDRQSLEPTLVAGFAVDWPICEGPKRPAALTHRLAPSRAGPSPAAPFGKTQLAIPAPPLPSPTLPIGQNPVITAPQPAAAPAGPMPLPLFTVAANPSAVPVRLPTAAVLWPGCHGIQAGGADQPTPEPEPAEMAVCPRLADAIDAFARSFGRREPFWPRPMRCLDTSARLFAGYAALPEPAAVKNPVLPVAAPLCAHSASFTVSPVAPPCDVPIPRTGLPEPPFIPLEFFCAPGARPIAKRPVWLPRGIPPIPPRYVLPIAASRVEEISVPEKPRRKSVFPRIFSRSGNGRHSGLIRDTVKTLAASLLLGSLLWYGLTTGRQAVRQDSSSPQTAPAVPAASNRPPDSPNGENTSRPSRSPSFVARIRQAISQRAASELSDTFHQGMADWGATSQTWIKGWSRHPDGFVRPGQLALFHPSQSYTDYHLEFFGQIERKAIDWAVRAKDPKNFYAMKFSVIEPGLRPMIAILHYPVVGGKRGRPIQVPLNVMVHNNTPYHVTVDVRGDHIVTSLEGQEVDTWIDDTLPTGGVGFFAEAGEKSRLYWMKISRNQDFLGRVCAFFSGSASDTTGAYAASWPPPNQSPAAGMALFGGGIYSLDPTRRFPPWKF